MTEVKVIKLINSETLIAEVEQRDEYLHMTNPLIVVTKHHMGHIGSFLHNWISITDQTEIPIHLSQVITVVSLRTEMVEYYLEVVKNINNDTMSTEEFKEQQNQEQEEEPQDYIRQLLTQNRGQSNTVIH
jgi:hypothetical protein